MKQNSGRVIGVGRVLLTLFFLLALIFDQDWHGPELFWLLGAYLVLAIGIAGATWRNWWLDHRLAVPAHVSDLALFAALVVFTDGYATPFYLLSVYLVLAPALRWGWRQVLLTAAAVAIIYFFGGLLSALEEGVAPDILRIVVRTGHLLTLSLLLIWFGAGRELTGQARGSQVESQAGAGNAMPDRRTIELGCERFPAARAFFVWWEKDEPWIHLAGSGPDSSHRRLSPEQFGEALEEGDTDRPFLYDLSRNRALAPGEHSRARTIPLPAFLVAPLPAGWGLRSGLVVRVRASVISGELILDGVEALAADDLKEAERLGAELSNLFDRYSALSTNAERAVEKAKLELSRDLHDSVLQSLSGASFRLEALRSWIRSGRPADDEIELIQKQLAEEQRNVRGYISSLQTGTGAGGRVDIGASLRTLMAEIERQWDIDGRCIHRGEGMHVPSWMEHPLKQIVKEAVANAVRHGRADMIDCELSREGDNLVVVIRDNGAGFALQGRFDEPALKERGLTPWSIYERTKSIGGSVSLFSTPTGSQLRLELPLSADL